MQLKLLNPFHVFVLYGAFVIVFGLVGVFVLILVSLIKRFFVGKNRNNRNRC